MSVVKMEKSEARDDLVLGDMSDAAVIAMAAEHMVSITQALVNDAPNKHEPPNLSCDEIYKLLFPMQTILNAAQKRAGLGGIDMRVNIKCR